MMLPDHLSGPLVRQSLRATFKSLSRLPLPLTVMRAAMESSSGVFRTRTDVHVDSVRTGGVPGLRLTPSGPVGGVLLHLHGGAFFAGSSRTHEALAAELAARGGVVVHLLDYRRAPEHVYPAALQDGLAAWQGLLADGWRPEQIVLGGDSAGCALILAMAIALRDTSQALPAGLLMLSPFLDLTLSLPSVRSHARRDPMLTAHVLKRGGDSYRGQLAADDERVSPLLAPLHALPPTLVQAGSEEILVDDARRFDSLARAAGVAVRCEIHDGMWHNFQMFHALVKQAGVALDNAGAFLRQQLPG